MEGKKKEDEWANIFITVNHSASTREVHTTRKRQQQSGAEKGRIAGIRTEKEMHQELCCIVQLSARPRYIVYTSGVHTHTNTYSHKRQTRRHTLGMCRVLFLFFSLSFLMDDFRELELVVTSGPRRNTLTNHQTLALWFCSFSFCIRKCAGPRPLFFLVCVLFIRYTKLLSESRERWTRASIVLHNISRAEDEQIPHRVTNSP